MTGAELVAIIKAQKLEKYNVMIFVMEQSIVFEEIGLNGKRKIYKVPLDGRPPYKVPLE